MDTEHEPPKLSVSSLVQSQGPIKTWRSSKKAPVIEKTPDYLASRFQGDGVRYKAKLIGIDEVPEPQGDKMCLDSMMKLKGWEVAARQQRQHKQRVWLKVSTTGVLIIDEKTGVVEHKHVMERISSLKKDGSDPRAFSYIYGHEGSFKLFFIRTANAADPVIEDIKDVCQIMTKVESDPQTPTTQNGTSLLLDEQVATPQRGLDDMDLFNPVPSSPSQHANWQEPAGMLSHDELMDIFTPTGTHATASPTSPSMAFSQPGPPLQHPWVTQTPPALPGQTAGVIPFTLPTATAWGQQGLLGPPYSGFNGNWKTTGPWPPQQTVSGWGQASPIPQGASGAQPAGVMTFPGGVWGLKAAHYPNTAGSICPPEGDGFPQFTSPTQSPITAQWQIDPAEVSVQVSNSFSSDA